MNEEMNEKMFRILRMGDRESLNFEMKNSFPCLNIHKSLLCDVMASMITTCPFSDKAKYFNVLPHGFSISLQFSNIIEFLFLFP